MVRSAAPPRPIKCWRQGVRPVSLMSVVDHMVHAPTGKGVCARAAATRTVVCVKFCKKGAAMKLVKRLGAGRASCARADRPC